MKLKNLTVIALTGMVCMTACTSQPAVEGKWVGGAGKTVYLQQKADDQTRVVDSAVVAADGSFAFALPAGKIDVYELSAANEARKNLLLSDVPVVVTIETETETNEDSTTVDVLNILAEGDEQKAYEEGTELTMITAMMSLGRMLALSNILNGKDTTMTLDSAMVAFDQMDKNMATVIHNYVDSAKNNYGVAFFIKDYMIPNTPFDSVQAAYNSLTDRVKQSAPGLTLKEAVDALASVSIGGTAPDITLMTPDSTELSLSSLRGHYVLLDFWASWCGPCLREVPNVKAIYDKYHDKGFEIYGVSLDETPGPWKAAIKKNEMNWHHVSSLKGWDCPTAKRYNVTGIPRMYIINPEGKIIAMDLRGEELANFVASLYE